MKLNRLISILAKDLKTYEDGVNFIAFTKNMLFCPGFKYIFWMRITRYLFEKKILMPLFIIAYFIHLHYKYKFGIQIPFRCDIDEGFNICHFNCMVIHTNAKIGKNCYISQGITIGISKGKVPVIGDNVYLGAGAKVIGGVRVGNNVSIGANCVVTKDVPDNTVVVGVPGYVVKYKDVKDKGVHSCKS